MRIFRQLLKPQGKEEEKNGSNGNTEMLIVLGFRSRVKVNKTDLSFWLLPSLTFLWDGYVCNIPISEHQALESLGSWRRDQTSLNICQVQHLRHLSAGESGCHSPCFCILASFIYWYSQSLCRLWIRVGTYVQEKLKVSENLSVLEAKNANAWALAGHLKN